MKSSILSLVLLLPGLLAAQTPPPSPPPTSGELSEAEQRDLSQALQDAGNSPIDFIRALENHLQKYPQTPKRLDFDRALVKAAIETKDEKRIIQYGSRVLEVEKPGDPLTLERVSRALLERSDKESNQRALDYAKRLEAIVRQVMKQPPLAQTESARDAARFTDEAEQLLARSLVYESRAHGNLGQNDQAIELARQSFSTMPTAVAAHELGRWLAKAGRDMEAVQAFADAFTIPDPKATDADRMLDRRKMAELYQKSKNTTTGLGDLVLDAYDRTSALIAERKIRLKQLDPNPSNDPLQFTLTGLDGKKLELASLKGKVVVMDFWATWCGPCRIQHPMYEEVKKRFKFDPTVVFLSVNTDEDRSQVGAFLDAQKWDRAPVYFEDGLSSVLRVTSIPTTVIFSKSGQISSRMNGFVEGRFVDLLTERIRQTLAE